MTRTVTHPYKQVIPKSVTQERIQSNAALFDFKLCDADVAVLDALDEGHHYCWNADDVL